MIFTDDNLGSKNRHFGSDLCYIPASCISFRGNSVPPIPDMGGMVIGIIPIPTWYWCGSIDRI